MGSNVEKIYDNESDLFYLSLDNKIISYLYCAKLYDFVWGWVSKKFKNTKIFHLDIFLNGGYEILKIINFIFTK